MWEKSGDPSRLVSPESATSHYCRKNKAVTIPINRNHSDMVKFTRGDTNLGSIISSLKDMLPPSKTTDETLLAINSPSTTGSEPPANLRDDDLKRDFLRDRFDEDAMIDRDDDGLLKDFHLKFKGIEDITNLHTPELDHRMNSIEDPFAETFAWIFHMSGFTSWLQSGSGLFWIHGKPGSGKSTLMKFIVQHKTTLELLHNWKTNDVEVKASFFFHYRGSALQKSFEGLLRSLVAQILSTHLEQHGAYSIWKEYVFLCQKRYGWRKEMSETFEKLDQIKRNIAQAKSRLSMSNSASTGVPGSYRFNTTVVDEPEFSPQFLPNLERDLNNTQEDLELLKRNLATVQGKMAQLADNIRLFVDTPETKFLAAALQKWRGESKRGLIAKLEGILRLILEQETVGMDLVLFFDALDEFDGHLDMLSRFIKSLIDGPKGSALGTRVKVCFSSRPWEELQAQFSEHPGFALQDYTRQDIEQYAAGCSCLAGPSVKSLVPTIIARANGVFLWVALAVKILDETVQAARSPEEAALDVLEKRLLELPSDLLEFYDLIIERIKRPVRRYTFALLEILVRHTGSSPTACEIRDAVRVSAYNDFMQASDMLDRPEPDNRSKVAEDISAWGGGLVEIACQGGIDRAQLIHQTALEYVMGMRFKRAVLGDIHSIISENGHTFHAKYSMVMVWRDLRARVTTRTVEVSPKTPTKMLTYFRGQRKIPEMVPESTGEHMTRVAHHAEESEISTGDSLFGFLDTIPTTQLAVLALTARDGSVWDRDCCLLFLLVSYGATLSLRDWIESKSGTLGCLASREVRLPLLSFLISIRLSRRTSAYDKRYLAMASLLLDNGFSMVQQDLECCSELRRELEKSDAYETSSQTQPKQARHWLADSSITRRSFFVKFASIILNSIIRDHEQDSSNCETNCNPNCALGRLIEAGGVDATRSKQESWTALLLELESGGHDTRFVQRYLRFVEETNRKRRYAWSWRRKKEEEMTRTSWDFRFR